MKKHLACFLLIFSFLYQLFAQENVNLTFSHVRIALDYRYLEGKFFNNQNTEKIPLNSNLFGASVQYQSSFVNDYLREDKNSNFLIGDILKANLGLGAYVRDNPDITNPIATYYNFEFGLGLIWKINARHQLGLNLYLLKFARDKVSPNRSGSMSMMYYKYKNLRLGAGLEARRDRIFGWVQALQQDFPIPLQYHCEVAYTLKSNKNIGVYIDFLKDKKTTYIQNNIQPLLNLNFQIFYGIDF